MFRYNDGPNQYGPPCTDEILNWTDIYGDYGNEGITYQAAQEFDNVVMLWDGEDILIYPKTVAISGGTGGPDLIDLSATSITENSITLSWSDQDVDYYIVTRDNQTITQTTGLTFTDTNLTPNTTYEYQVQAGFNEYGIISYSDVLELITLNQSEPELTVKLIGQGITLSGTNPYLSNQNVEVSFTVQAYQPI